MLHFGGGFKALFNPSGSLVNWKYFVWLAFFLSSESCFCKVICFSTSVMASQGNKSHLLPSTQGTLEFFSSKLCSSCHKFKSVGTSSPEDTFSLHVNMLVSSHKCVFELCLHWSKSHFFCAYFPEFITVGSQWNKVMVPCCPAYMDVIWWNIISHLCSISLLTFYCGNGCSMHLPVLYFLFHDSRLISLIKWEYYSRSILWYFIIWMGSCTHSH